MNIIRHVTTPSTNWSPFEQLASLRNELSRLMAAPSSEMPRSTEFFNGWVPALDIYEAKDTITVIVELPGMKREQIDISLHDGALTVAGELTPAAEFAESETYRAERPRGRFHRSVSLPKPVDADKVSAAYKDGILTVTLPKAEEAKPRQISVAAA